ncbi:hypothetical protein IGI01_20505 [Bacillus thuringiensis]|nr:hypothetical protein [Bacillus thuringiensis]
MGIASTPDTWRVVDEINGVIPIIISGASTISGLFLLSRKYVKPVFIFMILSTLNAIFLIIYDMFNFYINSPESLVPEFLFDYIFMSSPVIYLILIGITTLSLYKQQATQQH